MSQWKDAKNEPPKESIECIIVIHGETMEFGYYNAKYKRFELPNPCAFDGWPIPIDGVTHWMPLPERPTTE